MTAITIQGYSPVISEPSEGNVIEIKGYVTPNQALQKLKTEQEDQMFS